MAQHDYNLANQTGAGFRADLNNALAAASSNNSGAAAPSTTFAYQFWADSNTGLLKVRNAANTAYVTVGTLASANLGLASLSGATFTGAVVLPAGSTVSGYLSASNAGTRNLIINGNPIINQRGYVSGTATSAANQYTLDRWRVVTSGQSITWTDSLGVRTVTAPAGGVEQVVEGASIAGSGTYSLSWSGTATATINGSAVTNGATVSLTGGSNATLKFASGTFSLVQLEPGSVATTFERRSTGAELALCQRYFLSGFFYIGQTTLYATTVTFPSTMRSAPTVTGGGAGYTNLSLTTVNTGHAQTTQGSQSMTFTAEL